MSDKRVLIMPEPIQHNDTIPVVTGVGNINNKDESTEEVKDEQST